MRLNWGRAVMLTLCALPAMARAARAPAMVTGIVAAESVYADIAWQLAGPDVSVSAILTNPATDPHLFEPSPATARRVAGAQIVIMNGLGYDAWMAHLLSAAAQPAARVITVATLLGRHAGDNPHLWYDPAAMPALVGALSAALAPDSPALAARRARLLASLGALQTRVLALRARYAGLPVAASEPIFGLMLHAIGLTDRSQRFQSAVMNGTEPRARDIAAFEDDLRARRVRVLILNAQTSDQSIARLAGIARAARIPIVSITETLPPGAHYQDWIGSELTALQTALDRQADAP